MLIKVKADGHNIIVPFPTALIFNRAAAKIVVKAAKKKEGGIAPPATPIPENVIAATDSIEITDENSFNIEKKTENGSSSFHFNYKSPFASGGKSENGEDKFPVTEEQLARVMKEIRRCKREMKGIPLVEVRSSDGDEVTIYL